MRKASPLVILSVMQLLRPWRKAPSVGGAQRIMSASALRIDVLGMPNRPP
jgi:hypothetical protein